MRRWASTLPVHGPGRRSGSRVERRSGRTCVRRRRTGIVPGADAGRRCRDLGVGCPGHRWPSRPGVADRRLGPRRMARASPTRRAGRSGWQYFSDGGRASAAMSAMDVPLPRTSYMAQAQDRPPWVRYVILVPCGPLPAHADLRDLRTRFMAFLQDQTAALLGGMTFVRAMARRGRNGQRTGRHPSMRC